MVKSINLVPNDPAMAQFIPISTFASLYEKVADLVTPEGMDRFTEGLEQEGIELTTNAGYSIEDFHEFVSSLRTDSAAVIYYGWVEQNDALLRLLTNKEPLEAFEDRAKHLDHQLSEGYLRFISPFLANQLLRNTDVADEAMATLFSFVQLLDEDHRSVVEDQLFSGLRKRVVQGVRLGKTVEEEQELINIVQPLCADEVITCVNFLSRRSYAMKLEYVDTILETIRAKSCTTRFANWVLKRMEEVALNREHEYKITDLRKELREGELTVKNEAKGRAPIRWQSILSIVFILMIGGGAFYVFYYQPFSQVEDDPFTNSSSFAEFSREERIKIDSLLREVTRDPIPEEIEIDPVNPIINGGPTLTIRKPFQNPRLEEIYQDWYADAKLKENYPNDSCVTSASFQMPDGTSVIDQKTGKVAAAIRNESDYEAVVYVAENKKSGKIHAFLLKPNETKTFEIDRKNVLFMVAGNDLRSFKAPAGVASTDELPTDKFRQHFCDTDINYLETINTSFKVSSSCPDKVKFMIMGAKNGYVHLIDLNQALEEY